MLLPPGGKSISFGSYILIFRKQYMAIFRKHYILICRLYDIVIFRLHGTSFMWSKPPYEGSVDYLFVDEAGQLSLIDTLAVSHCCSNLVLLGDPQQLKQPQQGVHPDGTEVSALEHVLQDEKTISDEQGIFLAVSYTH